MPTKRQHFVPRVYLKAWEQTVHTDNEPNKPIKGVYAFYGREMSGHGETREHILWKPHLYTVLFSQIYIVEKCPLVYKDFVDQIYNLLECKYTAPVYGKLGYSIIRTKKSIRKHIASVDQWEFFYEDGKKAKSKAVLNDIHLLNSYVIEEGLDSHFETKWEATLSAFLSEMKSDDSGIPGDSVRQINKETAVNMMSFFIMMFCRSPEFDGMGLYTWVKDTLLASAFGGEESKSFEQGLWYTELYRMIYKQSDGFYHTLRSGINLQCQMILFEAKDGAGAFITSDNPAFQHKSVVEVQNMTGFVFPLTPKYLLFFAKGADGIEKVDYRLADKSTVHLFNSIVYRHRTNVVIGVDSELSSALAQ